MNNSEFYALRDNCQEKLLQARLLEAIEALDGMAVMLGRASLMEEVRLLRQDYAMLLGVIKEEFLTVNRSAYFNEVHVKAYALYDDLCRYFTLHYTDSPVTRVWHRLRLPAERLADVYVPLVEGELGHSPTIAAVLADPLASYLQQFDVVWSSARWSADERYALCAYIQDADRPSLHRQTLVGAAGLGLLTFYDAEKFHLLLDVVEPDQVEVSVRAALMIALAASRYASRLPLDVQLNARVEAFFANESFKPLLRQIQKAIAVAVESPKLSAELEKGMSQALAQRKEVEELASQETIEDVEQLIEDDPRLKKFHEGMMELVQDFVAMHVRGVDINFNSFRMIPEMLPFFREAANWFCPFSLDHPLLFNINAALRFLGIMSREKSCDTDRYAMVLAMDGHVPEIHIVKRDAETDEETTIETDDIESVVDHLSESMEAITEQQRRSLTDIKDKVLYPIVVCAVQDAFRFFCLFPGMGRDANPFDDFQNFWDYDSPYFQFLYDSPKSLRSVADWYFDLDNYHAALELYQRIPEEEDSVELHRRLGFIYMNLKSYERAVGQYLEACTFERDDEWTLLQLVFAYMKLHRLSEAADVMRHLTELFPDNRRYERNLGELYLRQDKFDQALPVFVKLNYLTPDRRSILRALAWTHLGLGHYAEANVIYDRLLNDATVSANDYINAGHCALLQGDCTTAVAYYQQSLRVAEDNSDNEDKSDEDRKSDAERIFSTDYFFLIQRGIDGSTMQMLTDMILL